MVCVVGRKHSGKTTLLVQLAAALGRRGHRVMTIKHGTHTFSLDPQATDSWRHFHEGEAERVAMVAPDRFALVSRWSEELSPEAIAERHMADADVVLCEGFGRTALPRIEIFRRAVHPAPLWPPDGPDTGEWLAILTDDDGFTAPVPVLRLTSHDWLDALLGRIETSVMGRGRRGSAAPGGQS